MNSLIRLLVGILLLTIVNVGWAACPDGAKQTYKGCEAIEEAIEKDLTEDKQKAKEVTAEILELQGFIAEEIQMTGSSTSELEIWPEDLGREATVGVFSTGIYVENTTWAANKLGRIEIRGDGTNNLVTFEWVRVLVSSYESHDFLYPDDLMLEIMSRDFPSIRESSDCGRKNLDKSTRLPAAWRFEFLGSNSTIPNNCRFQMLTKEEQDKLWLLVNNIDRIVEVADSPVPEGTSPTYWLDLAAMIRAGAPDSFYR